MGGPAFLFPGQGAQTPGMGKELYDDVAQARRIFDEADEILGFPLSKLCFEGPRDELTKTENAQPAIFTVNLAAKAALDEAGVRPSACAGLSLGEYSALVAAGMVEFADVLPLVRKRGELMAGCDPDRRGTMTAVIGMDLAALEGICDKTAGVVVVANRNCPGQLVISGERGAVEAAGKAASEQGARRVIPLSVSGAFHSPLMAGAGDAFGKELEGLALRETGIAFYANVAGKKVTVGDVKDLLVRQITSPVLWEESIRAMVADGHDRMVEVGPGRVLRGFLKKIDGSIPVWNVGRPEDVPALAEAPGGGQ